MLRTGKVVRAVGTDVDLMLHVVKRLGMMVLENGGETYRAEEVIYNVCIACGMEQVEVFALPTGLFVNVVYDGMRHETAMKRVKRRSINLSMVDTANRISRQISAGALLLPEAEEQIAAAYQTTRPRWITTLAAALGVGFFAAQFGGGWAEVLISAVVGVAIHLLSALFRREDMYHVIFSLAGGLIGATSAVGSVWLFRLGEHSVDILVSASIMLLVPGLALVNAIRDTMRGDLISGTARVGEVAVIALSIAAGVGAVLSAAAWLGGGAL